MAVEKKKGREGDGRAVVEDEHKPPALWIGIEFVYFEILIIHFSGFHVGIGNNLRRQSLDLELIRTYQHLNRRCIHDVLRLRICRTSVVPLQSTRKGSTAPDTLALQYGIATSLFLLAICMLRVRMKIAPNELISALLVARRPTTCTCTSPEAPPRLPKASATSTLTLTEANQEDARDRTVSVSQV